MWGALYNDAQSVVVYAMLIDLLVVDPIYEDSDI